MYPQHQYHQALDPTSNGVPGPIYPQQRNPVHPPAASVSMSVASQPQPLYPQQPPPPQQHSHPHPHPPPASVNGQHNPISRHPPHHPPAQEPLPSASDVQQTLGLAIPQMAEFASSMVYLMWHARRPSVMALHSNSRTPITNALAHQSDNQETAHIANATSSAFKKFSRQVSASYACPLPLSLVVSYARLLDPARNPTF